MINEKMNDHESEVFVKKPEENHQVKRILAQLIATAAFGMMVLSVGTLIAAPTTINGAIYKVEPQSYDSPSAGNVTSWDATENPVTPAFPHMNQTRINSSDFQHIPNASEWREIQLDKVQAYWLGSVMYVVQPVGSIVSGFIQNHIGRRNGMMATSVVQLIGWLSIFFAPNIPLLFSAAVLMGLSIGFMEAPGLSFLGEAIEPRYRGIFSNISMNMWIGGFLLQYLFSANLSWRYVCLASGAVPIINFLMLLLIPESPTFLLLQGKEKEAVSALRWLRGWTSSDVVKEEYESLRESLHIAGKSSGGNISPIQNGDGGCRRKKKNQVKMLLERRVRFPILMIAFMFLTQHCLALAGPKPFLVHIFTSLHLHLSPNWLLVWAGLLQNAGVFICAFIVKWMGKRRMLMISGYSSSAVCLLLALYLYISPQLPLLAALLFAFNFFLNGLGIMSLPWCLVAEAFPAECRGSAAGITAASSYLLGFLTTITFKPLEDEISLWGCLLLYSIVGLIGTTLVYFKLPETEGKTLSEIQQLFESTSNSVRQSKPRFR